MLKSEMSRTAARLLLLLALSFITLTYTAQPLMAQTETPNLSSAPLQTAPQREATEQFAPAPVIVMGAVRAPGRFILRRQVRLLEILAQVGGFAEQAGESVRLVRRRAPPASSALRPANDDAGETAASEEVFVYQVSDLRRGDERANPYLQPGDIIVVPEAEVIYIFGAVIAPQGMPLTVARTLMEAIARAGGLRPEANGAAAEICRQVNDGAEVRLLRFSLMAIQQGRAPDVSLRHNDMIFIPLRNRIGGGRAFRHCYPRPPLMSPPVPVGPFRVIY